MRIGCAVTMAALSNSETALERLEATIIDGRAENVRFRQDQLQNLHRALCEEEDGIRSALSADSSVLTPAEIETEYALTLDAIRHFYDSLDFDRELEDEYRIANGKTYKNRRVPIGIVLIRPTRHTRLFSVVVPLAAAIAAGNCVVLELVQQNGGVSFETDEALGTALSRSLDINILWISNEAVGDKSVLDKAVLVDQNGNGSSATLASQLISSSRARAIAVVDRTADIEVAARAITRARFSFGGASPYSPDLVLVNEFAKERFFKACLKYATELFAASPRTGMIVGDAYKDVRVAVKGAKEKGQVVNFGSDDFNVVDVLDKYVPSGIPIPQVLPGVSC